MSLKLVVINGLPATGKTTLARNLSVKTNIPAIGKDEIKELLFDKFGIKNREWSAILGAASIEVLYTLAAEFLAKGESIIIEGPFWPQYARSKLTRIIKKYAAEFIEIYCITEPTTRAQRGQKRDKDGQRHHGHLKSTDYKPGIDSQLLKKYAPLKIGKFIQIDTTEPEKIDINKIVKNLS
jgi:predicted kinase